MKNQYEFNAVGKEKRLVSVLNNRFNRILNRNGLHMIPCKGSIIVEDKCFEIYHFTIKEIKGWEFQIIFYGSYLYQIINNDMFDEYADKPCFCLSAFKHGEYAVNEIYHELTALDFLTLTDYRIIKHIMDEELTAAIRHIILPIKYNPNIVQAHMTGMLEQDSYYKGIVKKTLFDIKGCIKHKFFIMKNMHNMIKAKNFLMKDSRIYDVSIEDVHESFWGYGSNTYAFKVTIDESIPDAEKECLESLVCDGFDFVAAIRFCYC